MARLSPLLPVLCALLCAGCPTVGLPPVDGGPWEPADRNNVYPPSGRWALRRDDHALITAYRWDGTAVETMVPLEMAPVLDVPAAPEIITTATFTVEEEHYTQGEIRFDPPVAGQLDRMTAQAWRTEEETQYVRDHGPTANFSTWTAEGEPLSFTPTGAPDPYALSIGGGGGWFGCWGAETMAWVLYWTYGRPWELYKTYVVGFSLGPAETPPGTCGPGLERLAQDLASGTLPEGNLWRTLDELMVFGADRSVVPDLAFVAVQVRYVVTVP